MENSTAEPPAAKKETRMENPTAAEAPAVWWPPAGYPAVVSQASEESPTRGLRDPETPPMPPRQRRRPSTTYCPANR
jgi:hypothetical protein